MSKTVDWLSGTITCECANCGSIAEIEFDGEEPNFKVCQQELKKLGWVSAQIDGEWEDFCCKECKQKFLEKEKNDV